MGAFTIDVPSEFENFPSPNDKWRHSEEAVRCDFLLLTMHRVACNVERKEIWLVDACDHLAPLPYAATSSRGVHAVKSASGMNFRFIGVSRVMGAMAKTLL